MKKIGDKVEIVNYGHRIWCSEKGAIDIAPELVGQTGTIADIVVTQGVEQYKLDGPNKTAWYDGEQLMHTT